MSNDGCFELDLTTIEGLVSRGFLADSTRHDMDAVEQALQAFLRYEFGGKRPANPSPAKPIRDVLQFPPVATVIVSPQGRAALSELVVEQTLVALVNAKMLSPPAAVDILTRVEELALERKLYGGVVEGARFARANLLYQLGQLGLVSSPR
jgi:hypothetical protein